MCQVLGYQVYMVYLLTQLGVALSPRSARGIWLPRRGEGILLASSG